MKMAKKKTIRQQFDSFFKSGNERMIKKMLSDYPWLLHEQQNRMDDNMRTTGLVISSLGVMNDENGGKPVSVEDVIFSLRMDFKQSKKGLENVANILEDAETMGYCIRKDTGWILTLEGERICDNYLNSHIQILGSELE